MICIQTGKSIADPNRMKFQTNQFFVKSAEEMGKVFQGYEQVLRRTRGNCRALQPEAGEDQESVSEASRCREGETHRQLLRADCARGHGAAHESAARVEGAGQAAAQLRRVRRAAEPRDRHHQADAVSGLLPDRVGLYPLCQGERNSGGSGARLGRRLAGGLCDGHHRHRSDPERAAV